MAIDEAVSTAVRRNAAPPTLRLYGWDSPSITIGRFQNARRDLNIGACREDGVSVVRRITGGRAVYHARELTYSVCARSDDPLFPNNIKGTFHQIALALSASLKSLGIETSLFTPTKILRTPVAAGAVDCFLSTSWYEVVSGGKKLVGSAQRRWPTGFLQQGSIRIMKTDTHPGKYFKTQREQDAIQYENATGAITSVESLLGKAISPEEFGDRIAEGFSTVLSIHFSESGLTLEENELACALEQIRYGSDSWNLDHKVSARDTSD